VRSQPALSRLALVPTLAVRSCVSRLSAMWRRTAMLAGPWSVRTRLSSEAEGHIKDPLDAVLDAPVAAHSARKSLSC